MTISDLGTASTTSGTTVTMSVTVPAGAVVVVIVADLSSSLALASCSDATNGLYSLGPSIAINSASTNGFFSGYYFLGSANLSSVTLTYTKGISGRYAAIAAAYVTGLIGYDSAAAATNAGNGIQPTVTGGTPSQSSDFWIAAAAMIGSQSPNFSQPAGWSNVPDATNNSGSAPWSIAGNLTSTNSTAQTYTPTAGKFNPWAAIIMAFKQASVGILSADDYLLSINKFIMVPAS